MVVDAIHLHSSLEYKWCTLVGYAFLMLVGCLVFSPPVTIISVLKQKADACQLHQQSMGQSEGLFSTATDCCLRGESRPGLSYSSTEELQLLTH